MTLLVYSGLQLLNLVYYLIIKEVYLLNMVYKIALVTDAHLGYSSGRKFEDGLNLRLLDGYRAWQTVVDEIVEAKPDVFFLGGDIFHQATPTIRTIVEAQTGFRKLADAGIPVYCIVGNHDATDIRSQIPASGVLNEPHHNIYSFTEPYKKVEIAPGIFVHCLSHHAYSDQEATMRGITLEPDAINILLTHGSTFDTNRNIMLHDPQEPREVVLPQSLMDLPWDFTFLGHIHERGFIGSKDGGVTDSSNRKQFYGGSLIRRGFADQQCKLGRGWTMWTIDDDKQFIPEIHTIEQRPQFDLPGINADKATAAEVEEAVMNQLKTIRTELGEINNSNAPIVRQYVYGISPNKYVAINWKQVNELTDGFLTYTLQKETKSIQSSNDDSEKSADLANVGKQQDIVEAFDKWSQSETNMTDIEDKDLIVKETKAFLRQGQQAVLDSDK